MIAIFFSATPVAATKPATNTMNPKESLAPVAGVDEAPILSRTVSADSAGCPFASLNTNTDSTAFDGNVALKLSTDLLSEAVCTSKLYALLST